jgi:hypothetical protein
VARSLGRPLTRVTPIACCPVPGRLHSMLRAYKDGAVAESRSDATRRLSVLLAEFLSAHRRCLAAAAGGSFDLTVAVPSSVRPGGPPLRSLRIPWSPETLLVRGPGALGHLCASGRAYEIPPAARHLVSGSRVLLLDDALTTGAHVQSAAFTIRQAGARAVAIVVLGRIVRPDANDHAAHYWRAALASDDVGGCGLPSGRCRR